MSSGNILAHESTGESSRDLLRAAVLDNTADEIDDTRQEIEDGNSGGPPGGRPRAFGNPSQLWESSDRPDQRYVFASGEPGMLSKPANEERLITKDEVKMAICDLLGEEKVSIMLGPRPLWAQFDDPDPDPSMALHLQKMLSKAIESLIVVRVGVFTPPPSVATDTTSESSEFSDYCNI